MFLKIHDKSDKRGKHHFKKYAVTGPEPGSTAWKAAMLTILPPTLNENGKFIFKFKVFSGFLMLQCEFSVSKFDCFDSRFTKSTKTGKKLSIILTRLFSQWALPLFVITVKYSWD